MFVFALFDPVVRSRQGVVAIVAFLASLTALAASPISPALAGTYYVDIGPVEFALDLPRDARLEWAVYDLEGRTVGSEGRTVAAGRTRLRWEGRGVSGDPVATGVYLVRARVDGAALTRGVVRF